MGDLARAFRLLPPRLAWQWAGLLPLVLVNAAVEGIAAAAVLGLLGVLAGTNATVRVPFVGRTVTLSNADPAAVLQAVAVVMVLFAGRLVVLSGISWARMRLMHRSVLSLSDRLLTAYLGGPYARLSTRDSSAFLERARRLPEVTVEGGFNSIGQLTAEILVVVALLGILAATAPMEAAIAVTATAVLLLAPAVVTRAVARRWGTETQQREQDLTRHLQQALGAMREIRVYGRERFFAARVADARARVSRLHHARIVMADTLRWSVETIFVLVLLIVVAVATSRGNAGELVPLVGLYAYAGFRLVPSANRITLALTILRGALPVVSDLNAEIDGTAPELEPAHVRSHDGTLTFERDIVFDRVTVSHAETTTPALEDVSFRIARGESVGIVGMSGAGKSTLVDVLLGLREPTSGHVLVDGQDIRTVTRQWQDRIGYVGQSFYLANDSLRANIAFGVERADIDGRRLADAARAARLDEVTRSLPDGLDTLVGERGARLSGGERQRVAIARALYHQPPVLVFDEATSALDAQTEREVALAIADLHGERTIVVVAHRISTVAGCDRIVLLMRGRVKAIGTFAELLERDQEFARLVSHDLVPGRTDA